MNPGAAVHLVLPEGVDDAARPSGGNTYDRRVRDGLRGLGWDVREHVAPGGWPWSDQVSETSLAAVLTEVPDGSTVLVDGLVASAAAAVLVPAARRLRLVVLVHLPLGGEPPPGHRVDGVRDSERAVLSAARAVVATSVWTRRRLLELYGADGLRAYAVHVAEPGADVAEPAEPSADGSRLLCVGAVVPHKGQDVLLEALTEVRDRDWQCVCVGPLDRDPDFAERLRKHAVADGVADRLVLAGARTGAALDRAYAGADLLVVASLAETYAMVVTEALARGLPVLASEVGGLPSAMGRATDGRRPGLLVRPGDPAALAAAVRRWLQDAGLRLRLREAALERRRTLRPWTSTAGLVADVLAGVAR